MIKTLIANLEQQLDRIENNIDQIKSEMSSLNNLVNQHHHDLYGNGKKGLIQRLEELESKINNYNKVYVYLMAIISVIVFLPKVKEFLVLIK